jgi:HD superfamily phosphohydrolase
MQFLQPNPKPKIIRTRLYGDQEFSRFELELLHTPIMQRLYELKQLGFTDRVYPDAVHARFNHVLGTTEVVERMARRLLVSLNAQTSEFRYRVAVGQDGSKVEAISSKDLADHLNSRIASLRLMALLHDVTHGAFGHTLEDEVNVFNEKHDDPARQVRFFNALVAQLLYLWCTEERLHKFSGSILEELALLSVSPGFKQELQWAEELAAYLSGEQRAALAAHLRQLEFAFRLLLRIEFAHGHDRNEPALEELLVSALADKLDSSVAALDFVFHRDLFLVDLVGNTICADLLDYARRDAENAGLRVQFDDRFLRYLCVVSVEGTLSPTESPAIRAAIQVFTDKMRHDVLSEISGILKTRYLINERVLFHPTKCAAGAMLGTAVQLLGLRDLPGWMQVLGDTEFLAVLSHLAANIENLCLRLGSLPSTSQPQPWSDFVRAVWTADTRMAELITEVVKLVVPNSDKSKSIASLDLDSLSARARAARDVLWRLNSRRLPKLAYRLRTAHHTGGASDETIAEAYSHPKNRYTLERRIEQICNLPTGSIVVHCPKRKTSMKVAQVLVVGANLTQAAHLRNVTKISPEGLEPYEREILAIEEMYRSIWQFHAFLDPAYWDKQPIVEWAFERELGFPNDRLLAEELSHNREGTYAILAGELRDEIPPKWLPKVMERVDAEMFAKMRLADSKESPTDRLRQVIREVLAEVGSVPAAQLGLPGISEE